MGGLIEGQPIEHILGLTRGKLKQKSEELGASLEGDLSTRHLFVLAHLETHIQTLENQLVRILCVAREGAYETLHEPPTAARRVV